MLPEVNSSVRGETPPSRRTFPEYRLPAWTVTSRAELQILMGLLTPNVALRSNAGPRLVGMLSQVCGMDSLGVPLTVPFVPFGDGSESVHSSPGASGLHSQGPFGVPPTTMKSSRKGLSFVATGVVLAKKFMLEPMTIS